MFSSFVFLFHVIFRYAQKKADEIKAISFQSAIDTVEKLEIKLTEFAKKHQSEIQNDPVFRQRYVRILTIDCLDTQLMLKKNGTFVNLFVIQHPDAIF